MKTGTVAIIAALVIATALASAPTAFAGDSEPLIAPVCPADLNADNIVDRADLDRLLRFYGACADCDEDLNRDKFVDDADVAIMIQQWGPCSPHGDVFGGDHSKGSLTDAADSLSHLKDRAWDSKKRTPEDVNDDGIVDMADILTVAKHVGQEPTGDKAFSDVNNDGRIDEFDIWAIAEYVISGESIGG